MSEVTGNSFVGGMNLDLNNLQARNSTLTNALNATITTFNGNEYTLLNDLGNVLIKNSEGNAAALPVGYIPIGVASHGGVMYIASFNGTNGEIGCFPSPGTSGTLELKYLALQVGLGSNGALTGLNTPQFNFDYNHPVLMLTLKSYDGSINLILTDNKNRPRLINTGFSVKENGSCTIINRYGENNTNRYHLDEKFDVETSLIKGTKELSKVEYKGLTNAGQLRVGLYSFYVTACDKDGNESDFICESGIIPVFHGTDGIPSSINGGTADERSDKAILLTISNIDSSYSYIQLYYSRCTCAPLEESITKYYKISLKYPVSNLSCDIVFTGYEAEDLVTKEDINPLYINIDSARAQTDCSNILFLGNVKAAEYDFNILLEFSLKIYPKLKITSTVVKVEGQDIENLEWKAQDHTYKESIGYAVSKNVYDKVGYHNEEIYRFGIVYILNDNTLSPVFNILGVNELTESFSSPVLNDKNIDVNSSEYSWKRGENWTQQQFYDNWKTGYNNKGVTRINASLTTLLDLIGIDFVFPNLASVGEDTPEYTIKNSIKGYFYVRLKRIPTILGQGYVTNIAEEAFIPTIHWNGNKSSGGVNTYCVETFCEATLQGNSTNSVLTTLNNIPLSLRNSDDLSATTDLSLSNYYERRLLPLTTSMSVFSNGVNWTLRDPGTDNETFIKVLKELTVYTVEDYQGRTGTSLPEEYTSNNSWYAPKDGANKDNTDDDIIYIYNNYFLPNLRLVSESLYDLVLIIPRGYKTKENTLHTNYSLTVNIQVSSNYKKTLILTPLTFTIKRNDSTEYYDTMKAIYNILQNLFKDAADILTPTNATVYSFDYKTVFPASITGSNFVAWCDEILKRYHIALVAKVQSDEVIRYYNSLTVQYGFWDGKEGDSRPSLGWSNDFKYAIINKKASLNTSDPTNNGKYDTSHSLLLTGLEKDAYGIFCPDFELNLPYYNNLYNGGEFKVRRVSKYLKPLIQTSSEKRHYYFEENGISDTRTFYDASIIAVLDSVSLVSVDTKTTDNITTQINNANNGNYINHPIKLFSAKCGSALDSSFKYAGAKYLQKLHSTNPGESESTMRRLCTVDDRTPCNTVRGLFGPYLGVYCSENIADSIVNIYIPNYNTSLMNNYFQIRWQDETPYLSISDRIAINNNNTPTCYRGDCFIGLFTHRLNRNFLDPTSPNNDTIVNLKSWSEAIAAADYNESMWQYRIFDTTNGEFSKKFNLGDVNAVQLGSWISFPCRCSHNICIRSIDQSNVSENTKMGIQGRPFYPFNPINPGGSFKVPESAYFNKGFNKSGNDRNYFRVDLDTYANLYYKNRIYYSNVAVDTGISNGNRSFKSTHFRDYCLEYGSIVKLCSLSGYIVCVFEHGVVLLNVGDRELLSEGASSNVYLTTNNVLPLYPTKVLSDMYGSQYEESIVQSAYYIYGVDVASKKIWRTNGLDFAIISDFTILSFLNNNLYLSGLIDVTKVGIKTHFNRFKNDIMFTLFDKEVDRYWNICYNENLASSGEASGWQTFYSWIPAYSANLGNCFITTDIRDSIYNNQIHLWKHGQSLFILTSEKILPTHWYGEYLPFEFEFVVCDKPLTHKIFNNIEIISNNATPESFHFEIVGDCFGFDKQNMFVRLELLKALYQCLGANISFDPYVKEIYNKCTLAKKSTIFPLYYVRLDTVDVIEDFYYRYGEGDISHDYRHLSGSEITYNKEMNEYRIWEHCQAVDAFTEGVLRGNMRYLEDRWKVLINPINIVLKNESTWKLIPMSLCNLPLPEGAGLEVTDDVWTKFKAIFSAFTENSSNYITNSLWNSFTTNHVDYPYPVSNIHRELVKVKDKYMKVRIRYSGQLLALINAINTYYTISYS